MFNNNSSGISSKFLNRMFRRVNGIVWDLQNGSIGIKTTEGIYTLTKNVTEVIPDSDNGAIGQSAVAASSVYGTSINPFDVFGMAIPAFATQVPLASIHEGDLIVGATDILGWVTGKTPNGLKLLDTKGMNKNYTPPKVAIMGQDGALVVQSLGGLFGGQAGISSLQTSMLPLMMMSGGDTEGLESILPLMLFGQMQQSNPSAATDAATAAGSPAVAANPLANMMPMLMMQAMSKKKKSSGNAVKKSGPFGNIDPMILMMMGGMGGAATGGINPMMLMAMGGLGDDDAEEVSLPITNAGGGFVPALQRVSKF